MTLIASTMAMNLKLSEFVLNYINQIVKKAEWTYVKCKRYITNAYLEKSKSYV